MKIEKLDVLWFRITTAFLLGCIILFGSPQLRADGTETLGPPSIAIASGTDVIMNGTGLVLGQPGNISLTVPVEATVKQVLIYWEGQDIGSVTGDDDIIVDGNLVTGALIGGPIFWLDGGISQTYRADITNLALVGVGGNTLTVEGLNFTNFVDGAGVLVIIDDGSVQSNIELRDGNDLAFFNWPTPKDTTVPQTFTFPASSVQRTATLSMFVSAVTGSASSGGPVRPTAIEVTVSGVTQIFNNLLDSNDGQEWDTVKLSVDIPANATSLTVQVLSVDNLGTGDLPASLTWNAAALQVPPTPVAALGDRVWNDLNGNGIQDAGEQGIANVSVDLFDADCTNHIANTATDNNGIYGFTDLATDQGYCVKFDHGSVQQQLQCTDMPGFLGLTASPVNASGATGATDSDADPVTGETANIILNPGDNDTTWDAGFYCPSKIGDRLVNDLNRDGIQDTGEPGISGQTVTLLECQSGVPGNEITTTTTDTDGIYMFGLLPPGEYSVRFTLPDGFVQSPQNIGTDEAIDCDANPATGVADCVTLAPNQNNADVDACANVPPSAGLGDFVFTDKNADGIQDAGELGIAGVPVTLLTPGSDGNCGTSDDVDVANTLTGADGQYAFNGLAGGTYCIAVDKSQVSCPFGDPIFSPQNADGSTAANDSDVDIAGKSGNIALPEATFDSSWDAGIFCPASLGDRVWKDDNRDGEQTAGEPDIADVTVELADCNGLQVKDIHGNLVNATATDGTGLYLFSDLLPGQYQVKFSNADATLEFTTANAPGVATDKDSDAVTISGDGTMGTTACITLDSGEQDLTWDAGLREKPGSKLGDFVWEDLDADGIQDSDELGEGIAGVEVTLLECDAQNNPGSAIASMTTDANGMYLFENLLSGKYAVQFGKPTGYLPSPQDQGADDVDSDAATDTGVTACVDLGVNDTNLTLDAGFFKAAALGDRVWNDENQDGLQNPGEPNIADVQVELFDCSGNPVFDVFGNTVPATFTDVDGLYHYSDLLPGQYVVKFSNDDATLRFTTAGPTGVKDPNDSDAVVISADGTMGSTECITLKSGEADPTWDAGLFLPEVCSACDGKVTEMTLRYNGTAPALIRVEQKKDGVVFEDQVLPGGTFSFVGTDKKGTLGTEISIYVDDNLNTKIHTSCSQPIGPGLVAGDFEVVRAYSRNGGLICPIEPPPPAGDCSDCDGKATKLTLQYNGSSMAFIKVVQKKGGVVFNELVMPGAAFTFSGTDKKGTLGTEISIYVDGNLNAKIHTSCSQPIGPGLVAGDFEVLEGYSRNGGLMCPIEPQPPADACSECDGKVTMLTLQYNGVAAARVVVKQKKGGVVFDADVQAGGQFTFSGTDKKGTLSTEISIYVDGNLNTSIHTSCSQPIGPGLVSGDFLVVEGYSRNGGLICPLTQ